MCVCDNYRTCIQVLVYVSKKQPPPGPHQQQDISWYFHICRISCELVVIGAAPHSYFDSKPSALVDKI